MRDICLITSWECMNRTMKLDANTSIVVSDRLMLMIMGK
jgi:hypothetical protein